MSVRLNVVVVQSPRMSNLQTGIVADIVIQLLGRPGIDVSMVTSLQPDEEHSSDRLMLAGLESDLAVIDWRGVDETLGSLAMLGLDVRRAPHALDREVSAVVAGSRRVYVFDLRLGFKAEEVVQTLLTILQQRQIVAVPLLAPKAKHTQPPADKDAGRKPAPSAAQMASPLAAAAQTSAPTEPIVSAPDGAERPAYPLAEDSDLDALVDSLNDIDL